RSRLELSALAGSPLALLRRASPKILARPPHAGGMLRRYAFHHPAHHDRILLIHRRQPLALDSPPFVSCLPAPARGSVRTAPLPPLTSTSLLPAAIGRTRTWRAIFNSWIAQRNSSRAACSWVLACCSLEGSGFIC